MSFTHPSPVVTIHAQLQHLREFGESSLPAIKIVFLVLRMVIWYVGVSKHRTQYVLGTIIPKYMTYLLWSINIRYPERSPCSSNKMTVPQKDLLCC